MRMFSKLFSPALRGYPVGGALGGKGVFLRSFSIRENLPAISGGWDWSTSYFPKIICANRRSGTVRGQP
jgi:hypothetical protein